MGRTDQRRVTVNSSTDGRWKKPPIARFKRFVCLTRRFLSENVSAVIAGASLCVAGASLCVAGASLYYTLEAQKSDLRYKEFSIKPFLILRYDSLDFSLKIANVGIGPAVVRGVAVSDRARCIDSKNLPIEKWTAATRAILPEIFNSVFGEFWSTLASTVGSEFRPFLSSKILSPGQYIQNGTEYVFAKAGDSDTKRFYELAEIPLEVRQKAIMSFVENAERIPIKITYCSVSGESCAELGTMTCGRNP